MSEVKEATTTEATQSSKKLEDLLAKKNEVQQEIKAEREREEAERKAKREEKFAKLTPIQKMAINARKLLNKAIIKGMEGDFAEAETLTKQALREFQEAKKLSVQDAISK